MITLEAVEKIYQTKQALSPALKGINLAITSGEIVGIIGQKGAGKTALLRCIALLDRPDIGNVIVDHQPLTHLKTEALKLAQRSIGLMTQGVELLNSRTVYQNIILPIELSKTENTQNTTFITSLLNLLGLTDKIHCYPKDLTQAEKKRVALARALVLRPKVLLCDEPTANVEPKSIQAILQILKEINERFKISVVICTQEIEVIKTICHRVAVLHQGEIIEEKRSFDLFLQPQSTLAKEWVKASTRLELPTALRRRLKPQANKNTNPVLRLAFATTTAQETLIAHIIQHFYLTIHIMQAHLEPLRDDNIAVMIIEVIDEHQTLETAIAFLASQSLFVEVLGYATRTS